MKRVFLTMATIGLLTLFPGITHASEHEDAEQAAMTVLDEFMAAFNGRDPVALADTYQIPHFRLARGSMSFWETHDAAVQAHINTYKVLPDTGWDRSEWVKREIEMASDTKVHVATQFRRLRADGSEIGTFDSLYIVIKKDGRWGIKMRSSFL